MRREVAHMICFDPSLINSARAWVLANDRVGYLLANICKYRRRNGATNTLGKAQGS